MARGFYEPPGCSGASHSDAAKSEAILSEVLYEHRLEIVEHRAEPLRDTSGCARRSTPGFLFVEVVSGE
jgi:hypothetical protein